MAKVILYGPDYSTNVRMIRLCLIEKGVDYEVKSVDILRGGNRHPDFLKLQPFGRVPVLVHDDFTLYETSAIARYVDEAFKGPKLHPADKKEAARMNQLISIIETEAYDPIVREILAPRAKHAFLGQQPDIERIKKATPEAVRSLKVIDGMIGDDGFLVGKALTLADIYLASIMAYFVHTPEGKGILTRLSKLNAWWEDMAKRPSIVETNPPMP